MNRAGKDSPFGAIERAIAKKTIDVDTNLGKYNKLCAMYAEQTDLTLNEKRQKGQILLGELRKLYKEEKHDV